MNFAEILIVAIVFLCILFVPYDNYLSSLAQRIADSLLRRNKKQQPNQSTVNQSGRYNMQIIVWKNNIPKIDRNPVEIQSEEDGKAMIIAVAKKKADQYKLEVSTALYIGDRYISSYRALPAQ